MPEILLSQEDTLRWIVAALERIEARLDAYYEATIYTPPEEPLGVVDETPAAPEAEAADHLEEAADALAGAAEALADAAGAMGEAAHQDEGAPDPEGEPGEVETVDTGNSSGETGDDLDDIDDDDDGRRRRAGPPIGNRR